MDAVGEVDEVGVTTRKEGGTAMTDKKETENGRRVRRAVGALLRYNEVDTGRASTERDESDAVDLVADLLHLVKYEGGDPERVMRMAMTHFEAEKDESYV